MIELSASKKDSGQGEPLSTEKLEAEIDSLVNRLRRRRELRPSRISERRENVAKLRLRLEKLAEENLNGN